MTIYMVHASDLQWRIIDCTFGNAADDPKRSGIFHQMYQLIFARFNAWSEWENNWYGLFIKYIAQAMPLTVIFYEDIFFFR